MVKIAVVDSYNLTRVCISQLLNDMGFKTTSAKDDKDFLNQILRTGLMPEVCFIDVDTSLVNNFKMAYRIKERYPEIIIVAYSLLELKQNCGEKYGADVFIEKSCTSEEIKFLILGLIKKPAREQASSYKPN